MIQAQQLKNSELEQEKLKERLYHKEKELATQLLNMAQKNEFLTGISTSIKEIREEVSEPNRARLQRVIRTISHDMASNESWEQLLASFKEIHHSYVEKLVNTYKLTANEVRLALMMKMNLSSKEIASLLNISDPGVKKARYRLRKKLSVDSDVNIQEFLLGLG